MYIPDTRYIVPIWYRVCSSTLPRVESRAVQHHHHHHHFLRPPLHRQYPSLPPSAFRPHFCQTLRLLACVIASTAAAAASSWKSRTRAATTEEAQPYRSTKSVQTVTVRARGPTSPLEWSGRFRWPKPRLNSARGFVYWGAGLACRGRWRPLSGRCRCLRNARGRRTRASETPSIFRSE